MKNILLGVALALTANAVSAETIQFDDWTYVSEVDPVSNTSDPYIYTWSTEGASKYGDGAVEGVNCRSMYIKTPGVVVDRNYGSNASPIQTRFGSESEASTGSWQAFSDLSGALISLPNVNDWLVKNSVWTNQKVFNHFFQRQVDESVTETPHHWVKVPAYGEGSVNYKFSDKGFNNAITKLIGSCSIK